MKSLLTSLFLCLLLATLNAQIPDVFDLQPCDSRPAGAPLPETELQSMPEGFAPESAIRVIPVVFHVLHQSGTENVSREDLLATLQRLNLDYKKLSPDLPLSPEVFKNQAVDMEVVFKLATIDPFGNCTDGINRIYTPLANFDKYDTPPVEWPTDSYLNIYVTRGLYQPAVLNSNGLPSSPLGWASFPNPSDNSSSSWNGIFLNSASTKMVSEAGNPSFTGYFSNIAHEAGHWLNLRHIWGDDDDCFYSDNVSDTPNQAGPSNLCNEDFPYITCNNGPNGNMFCNLMDYGKCLTMLTQGQKTRVTTALNGVYRYNIWQNINLIATGVNAGNPNFSCPTPPKADFRHDGLFLIPCEPDISVSLEERCFRAKPSSIEWYLPGGTPAYSTDFDLTVSYPAAGDYPVTMIAKNAYGSDTLVRNLTVQVIPNVSYSIGGVENFENANNIGDVGGVYYRLGDTNFGLCTTSGFNSSHSLIFPKKSDDFYCWFFTRKFTTTAEDSLLSFQVARSNNGTALLSVFARVACNQGSVSLGTFSVSELNTAPQDAGDFYPSGEGQWKMFNRVIPQSLRDRNDVQFIFGYTGGETNNFFIDDIRVTSQLATAVSGPETDAAFELFPNPATDQLRYRFDQPVSGSTLVINDLYGRVRLRETPGAATSGVIELVDLPPGAYWCRLLDEHGRPLGQPQKVIVL